MSEALKHDEPETLELARELVGELGASRDRFTDFVDTFLTDLDKLRREVAYQERRWEQEPALPTEFGDIDGSQSDEDREALYERLSEAEQQLEIAQRELDEERSTAKRATGLDEETRQLIDDLLADRDTLQQQLDHLHRTFSKANPPKSRGKSG